MTAVTADQLLRFGAAVAVLVALGFLLIRLACGREIGLQVVADEHAGVHQIAHDVTSQHNLHIKIGKLA